MIQLAKFLINFAQRLIQLGLHFRISVKRSRLLHAAIEQCDHAQIVGRPSSFVAALKKIAHELLDALGARRFRERGVACDRETHREEHDDAQNHHDHRCRRDHRTPIAPHKFAGAISQSIESRF